MVSTRRVLWIRHPVMWVWGRGALVEVVEEEPRLRLRFASCSVLTSLSALGKVTLLPPQCPHLNKERLGLAWSLRPSHNTAPLSMLAERLSF